MATPALSSVLASTRVLVKLAEVWNSLEMVSPPFPLTGVFGVATGSAGLADDSKFGSADLFCPKLASR